MTQIIKVAKNCSHNNIKILVIIHKFDHSLTKAECYKCGKTLTFISDWSTV